MGLLPSDEAVVIRVGQHQLDPTIITVNCPDKMGLACDLTRVIFEFGLSLVRGDLSTDGRWCLLVFWAVPRITTAKPIRWALLKKRLSAVCPPENQVFAPVEPISKPTKLYLLQVYSADRAGLLHDMSRVLWELELTVHKVKISTCPDGKVIDLFILSDNKGLLPLKDRASDVCDCVKNVAGGLHSKCELLEAGPEYGGLCCTPASNLPPSVSEQVLSGINSQQHEMESFCKVAADNLLSPAHTLLQITCTDRKGLLYDCLRTIKDFNLQVAYGRLSLSTIERGKCEIDIFVMQADGRKVVDPEKQKVLCNRLQREVANPLQVAVLPKGPDTELLVATPIEISGRGRPRVLFDVTLALKMLGVCIFQADVSRHTVNDWQWEIYRFLLIDSGEPSLASPRVREHIGERVKNILMG